jgi:hypothetical protein
VSAIEDAARDLVRLTGTHEGPCDQGWQLEGCDRHRVAWGARWQRLADAVESEDREPAQGGGYL